MSIAFPSRVTARYKRLRRSLAAIGFVCMGSLVRRYMPCGRSGCRCAGERKHWHGPYYQWTWKVKGKTTTVRLTAGQARLINSYVFNDRKLRRIVAKMRSISFKVVQAELSAAYRRKKQLQEIRG